MLALPTIRFPHPVRVTVWVSVAMAMLAVLALPSCPRVPSALAADGNDLLTVTESRDVSDVFRTPGHFLLHGPASLATACEDCENAHPELKEPRTSMTMVITVDVLGRPVMHPESVTDSALAARIVPVSDQIPAGITARIPVPPPRSF